MVHNSRERIKNTRSHYVDGAFFFLSMFIRASTTSKVLKKKKTKPNTQRKQSFYFDSIECVCVMHAGRLVTLFWDCFIDIQRQRKIKKNSSPSLLTSLWSLAIWLKLTTRTAKPISYDKYISKCVFIYVSSTQKHINTHIFVSMFSDCCCCRTGMCINGTSMCSLATHSVAKSYWILFSTAMCMRLPHVCKLRV